MKKNIQVIIKQQKSHLGPINSLKNVPLGYAFNYLIPKNIVEIATKNKIKHLQMLERYKYKKENELYLQNITIKEHLQQIKKINIRKKIGQNRQIFGSIIENEIIQKINNLTQLSISKKQIQTPLIKTIGIYNLQITLDNKIDININLYILPLNI